MEVELELLQVLNAHAAGKNDVLPCRRIPARPIFTGDFLQTKCSFADLAEGADNKDLGRSVC